MNVIIIIKFCVALLLTNILDGVRTESIAELLSDMADRGGIINGIFKPSVNGLLDLGGFDTMYKGQIFPPHNIEVTMKFVTMKASERSKLEYTMYTYLNAVNSSNAVAYGIPSIYYFGKWNNYIMMAMTPLGPTFEERCKAGDIQESELFIAIREFVKVMKYIHSCGIIHHGITARDLIIQNNSNGFIFDFSYALDMAEQTPETNTAKAKNDFKWFLFALFKFIKSKSKWHWLGFDDNDARRMTSESGFAYRLRNTNEGDQLTGLKRVFVQLAKHAYDEHSTGNTDGGIRTPFYDQLYRVIIEEMQKKGMAVPATKLSLSNIRDPFESHNWNRPPVVDYGFFDKTSTDSSSWLGQFWK